MNRILLVDDDESLCSLLSDFLTMDDFAVDCVHDGNSALDAAQREAYDLMVLDVMLPGTQGLDVLRRLRQRDGAIPVIMLTARGDDTDRIVGLELGADDYLPKPCNPRELSARIRAVLRRAAVTPTSGSIGVGALELLDSRRELLCHNRAVSLTNTEFEILRELMLRPREVVTKQQLSERVLKRELAPYDRSIDMHVSNIRKKLAAHGADQVVETVRGVGYRLVPDEGTPS